MMKINEFDDCIEGVVSRWGQEDIICYNKQKIITKLTKDNMSYAEAYDYFYYNIIGAWVGDTTPCFIEDYDEEYYSQE